VHAISKKAGINARARPVSQSATAGARLVLIALTALAGIGAADATTAAGRTKGAFAVSPRGAATYTIPIWAPPGPNGMQPNIALTYNSQQGNGYLGVGWRISGLSSIYRCNLTYAQDAAPAPIALVTGDGYCMDGQRLRLTSGTYGVAGSTYQTEVANFVQVTAYSSAGNGPAYWIAQDRNGRTYTYGNGGSSQVLASGTNTAVAWMLDNVSDPYGNDMSIGYSTTNAISAVVPSYIDWTPTSHGASTAAYSMTFSYSTSASTAPGNAPGCGPEPLVRVGNQSWALPVCILNGYVAGAPVQNTNLLGSVTVSYSNAAVKTYYLTYAVSPTSGEEDLTQVQECAGSGTSNCLLPTTFTYQSGSVGVATSATSTPLPTSSNLVSTQADLNGDGYPDLVYVSGTSVYVSFGSASGYGTPVNTGISSANLGPIGDLVGSGTAGILANNGGTWFYYTWNGSTFAGVTTHVAYTGSSTILADTNGDGLPDLVTWTTSESLHIGIQLNTSSHGVVSFSPTVNDAYDYTATNCSDFDCTYTLVYPTGLNGKRSWDFNGDGRQDLAFILRENINGGYIYILEFLLSNGTTFTAGYYVTSYQTASPQAAPPVLVTDWNGDGCDDVVWATEIYISGCNGNMPLTFNVADGPALAVLDWNGDGLPAVVVGNDSTIAVYLSTGNGVSALNTTSVPYNYYCQYFTFDANGDGLDDLGCWDETATSDPVSYYLHDGAGTPPDLLSAVTDGFGNFSKPTYAPLTAPVHGGPDGTTPYSKYSDGNALDMDYIGPLYVVDGVTISDPTNPSSGTYVEYFEYQGAHMNLQGRGFDGFQFLQYYDSRTEFWDQKYYFPNFGSSSPYFQYAGIQYEDLLWQYGSSNTIRESISTYTSSETHSGQYQEVYFSYPSNTTQSAYEYGGSENGDLITTTSTNYTIDNYGNPTAITKTITDNDPGSPYKSDTWTTSASYTPDESTSPWCLSLLTESQVTYSDSISANDTVTISKNYAPDTTHCDYTQIVTQPSSSQFKVTEVLAYDAFGNVNSHTVTGVGMAGRVTTTNWGTTGQFPMSVTDPTNATTQYNYNFSYGKKSSTTDPNLITVSWQYDGFGRKLQETRPDGTYTTYAYNDMATYGFSFHGILASHYLYGSNGSEISSGNFAYDASDEPLIETEQILGGSSIRNEVRYDMLGNVINRAFPCAFSSWTTSCTYWATNTYDVLNRLTESQRPISSTNSNPQTLSYAYAGRTTTVTDALSHTRTLIQDVNGWLRRTTDAYGYTVTAAFDAYGSKTAVTDSLSNTLWTGTYNYGLAPYLASATDMDMGAWTFTRDALGEKTGWKDAKGQSFSETYDALSRPLTRTEPDYFTQWTYGSNAADDNIGKLQSVCTGTGSSPTSCTGNPGYAESETYDSVGRQSQRTITLPGANGTFTYTWAYSATTGLLNALTYPASYPSTSSLQLQYAYSEGYLQSVTSIFPGTPNVTVWTNNAMNPAGQITEETLGNGIVTTRSYDAVTGWLGSDESGVNGGSGVKNLAFLYDYMGNLTQRQDNNLGLTENAYYDNDYRLTSTTLGGTQNLSVTYDDTMGNIKSRSDVAGGATWTYSTTQKHAVTEAGSSAYQYSYDANGNATARQGNAITWSSYNYPTTVNAGSGSTAETVAFSYGPDRRRWQQMYSGNGTNETTNYVGGLMEVIVGGAYRHYIYAGSEPVAVFAVSSAGNTFTYVLSDHQGSNSDLTNSSGASVVNESFTPFGQRRNPTTWSGAASNSDLTAAAGITRQGYTFQTQLGLWMGMNHMNGRVEDSITGRMLSADPNIPDPSDSQTYNRFSYVNNNPLTYVDPSGFDPGDIPEVVVTGTILPYIPSTSPIFANANLVDPENNPVPCAWGSGTCIYFRPARPAARPPTGQQGTQQPSMFARAWNNLTSDWDSTWSSISSFFNEGWPGSSGSVWGSLAAIAPFLGPVGQADTLTAEALSPEIASTFANGEYTVTTLSEPMIAFRFSGGTSPAVGNFLTDADTVAQISSPVSASIALNLPATNSAETLNTFLIPAGSTIYTGGVAGGADTATQIYIQNSSLLMPLSTH
jgi:RHS repeat-associated protein